MNRALITKNRNGFRTNQALCLAFRALSCLRLRRKNLLKFLKNRELSCNSAVFVIYLVTIVIILIDSDAVRRRPNTHAKYFQPRFVKLTRCSPKDQAQTRQSIKTSRQSDLCGETSQHFSVEASDGAARPSRQKQSGLPAKRR